MARAAIMTDMQPNSFTVSGGQYNATLFHGSRNIRSAAFDDERNQMRLNTTHIQISLCPGVHSVQIQNKVNISCVNPPDRYL